MEKIEADRMFNCLPTAFSVIYLTLSCTQNVTDRYRNEGSIRVGAYMNAKKSRERRPLLGDTSNYGETGDGLLPRIQENVHL